MRILLGHSPLGLVGAIGAAFLMFNASGAHSTPDIEGCSENCITAEGRERPDREKEYYISCAPRRDEPVLILNSPAPDDPVTDTWAQMVNSTWSFQVDELMTVDGIQYASGIVVDGRGRWTDVTRYMISAEWDCELYRD